MNKKITITLIVIIVLLAIGGVAYMMMQNDDATTTTNENTNAETTLYNKNANTNSNKNVNANKNLNENTNADDEDKEDVVVVEDETNTNTNKNVNTAKNTNTAAADSTYENERYGFSVELAKGMEFLSEKEATGYFPFGETEMKDEDGYEGEWFVSVYSSKKQADLITEHKDSLQDAEVKTEDVTLAGGQKATKATVSGSNRRTPIVAVYVEKNGRTFEILGNNDAEFEAFYKSFGF